MGRFTTTYNRRGYAAIYLLKIYATKEAAHEDERVMHADFGRHCKWDKRVHNTKGKDGQDGAEHYLYVAVQLAREDGSQGSVSSGDGGDKETFETMLQTFVSFCSDFNG